MRKYEVVSEEDLENYYKKVRKFKFKSFVPSDIKELIERFFSKKEDTYFLNGKQQGYYNTNRSIDDFLIIAKHYFPEKSIKEFRKELKDFLKGNGLEEGMYRHPLTTRCPNIRKQVIWMALYKHTNSLEHITFRDSGFRNCNLKIF